MRDKLINFLLVVVSCLVGFIICEFAYRGVFEWREAARWQRPRQFFVYSNSVWDFDAAVGYDYRPHARFDWTIILDGIPRRCGTFVTGALGSPGKGIDATKLGEPKFIVLGDSFTAMVHQDETWPDILSSLIESRSGHAAPILNLARDGYGVLQMFDQASQLVRAGHRPQAIIISILGLDLIRARFWRMTLERNGAVEVFTSSKPSLDISPETHARTLFIDPRVTRAWCEASRSSGRTDETATKIELAVEATWRADEAFFRHRINWFSVTDCYLCNRIRFGHPIKGIIRVSTNPAHGLTRFEHDEHFMEDLAVIRASGVPIWLVYLPYEPELRNARKQMTPQERSLLESLRGAVDRFIDLTPETPMGDAATPLTLLPEDRHPSHAGLEYYANEVYRRIMPLDFQK